MNMQLHWIRHYLVYRVAYICTYQVYMMVGRVVSLNCAIR